MTSLATEGEAACDNGRSMRSPLLNTCAASCTAVLYSKVAGTDLCQRHQQLSHVAMASGARWMRDIVVWGRGVGGQICQG